MLASFDEVDLERELIARLTGNRRLWLRAARLPRPPRSWLASRFKIGGWKRVMDLVWGATIERGMWSVLVIPVDEQFEFVLESCLPQRDQPAACFLTFHRPDEPLEDRDAAVLSWTSDFDVDGRTVNLAQNRKFETCRRGVDRFDNRSSTTEDENPRTFEECAQFDRRLQSENEWFYAARWSVTIGRCLRPWTKSILSVNASPG